MQPAAPRLLFDRALLRVRLARAVAQGAVDFLLQRVAADLGDRLDAVLRDFAVALDLGTPGPRVALGLRGRPGIATVVRASPLPEPAPAGWMALAADEEALPFATASLDLVVSALSLHRVNDLPGALVQIRRALRPDGLFIACLPGGRTLHELRTVLAAAESELEGGASPRVDPFGDLRDLGNLLQRAGFALPVSDTDAFAVRYGDLFGLLADLRAMGATNILHDRRKVPLRRAVLRRAAELYARDFADPDGRIRATFELVWLSGWAPHADQPKPLRPGSGRVDLADALKAVRTGKA